MLVYHGERVPFKYQGFTNKFWSSHYCSLLLEFINNWGLHDMSGMEPPMRRYRTKAPALDRPMTSEPLQPCGGPEGSMSCPPAVVNPLDQLKLVEPWTKNKISEVCLLQKDPL